MGKTRITAEPGIPQIIITREVFHGDPSPQAIVQTFEFEGAPGHVAPQTVTFTERGGRTLVRTVSAFQSIQDHDAMVASGMEQGARDSGDRLDQLLAKLQASQPVTTRAPGRRAVLPGES
jgi:activator of Hsp90 ATPase-like protein